MEKFIPPGPAKWEIAAVAMKALPIAMKKPVSCSQIENAILFELGSLEFNGTRFRGREHERDGVDEAAGVRRG